MKLMCEKTIVILQFFGQFAFMVCAYTNLDRKRNYIYFYGKHAAEPSVYIYTY